MKEFILDASFALHWCFEDEATAASEFKSNRLGFDCSGGTVRPAQPSALTPSAQLLAYLSYVSYNVQMLVRLPILITVLAAGVAAKTPVFETLYAFTGNPNGNPAAGVAIGSGGVLYGTTPNGGCSIDHLCGTAYSLTPPAAAGGGWTEDLIYDLKDMVTPDGLLIGSGGVLYGTGNNGSFGSVFSLTPPSAPGASWTETALYYRIPFAIGTLAINEDGVLFGAATAGPYQDSEVYSLTPPTSSGGTWTEDVLHRFTGGSGGGAPAAGVVITPGGVLYGATSDGGTSNSGVVFSLTPPRSAGGQWKEALLYTFTGASDGGTPSGRVVFGADGVLYSTTSAGGSFGNGTVFSLTPPASSGGAWTETVLYSFTGGDDGSQPNGGVAIGKDGVLYGTTFYGGASTACTSGCGTVFLLKPPASSGSPWTETVLHSFSGSDGSNPQGTLAIERSTGVVFGTTSTGGGSGNGTVFGILP